MVSVFVFRVIPLLLFSLVIMLDIVGSFPDLIGQVKGTAIPLKAWTDPKGSRRLRLPEFKTFDTYISNRTATLVTGLLSRGQGPEGPATGHLDTGFSWFPVSMSKC